MTIKPFLTVLFSIMLHYQLTAQMQVYHINNIPEELIPEADVVIRQFDYKVHVTKQDATKTHIKEAITILNKNGLKYADLVVSYNKGNHVKIISAKVFNKNGELLNKIKNKEIEDYSATGQETMISDNRVLHYSPPYSDFPFTVEYEYEVTNKNTYFSEIFPSFPISASVQNAQMEITSPPDYEFLIKEFNMEAPDSILTQKEKILTWTISNISASGFEPYAPDKRYYTPHVYVCPKVFSIAGIEGSTDTWKDFGMWVWKLNQGRDQLPLNTVLYLLEITKDLNSTKEKVKAVYQYMQSKTHYVGIQLGLGGLQPTDATTVDDVGYSDCKGLSNYMRAMLNAIGIDSHYALIKAGPNNKYFQPDFAFSQFNHAILCVPNDGDTIWLECTSQDAPFGFLGDFTDNRYALLITSEGGILTKTPLYDKATNISTSTSQIMVSPDGSASIKSNAVFKGLAFDSYFDVILESKSDQNKTLHKRLPYADFRLTSHNFTWSKDKAEVVFSYEAEIKNLGTLAGSRLLLNTPTLNSYLKPPQRIRNRQKPFILYSDYLDVDTLVYTIPAGYKPQGLEPKNITDERFGSYSARYEFIDGQIRYIRSMERNRGFFKPEEYADFVEFMNKIVIADKSTLILLKEQ